MQQILLNLLSNAIKFSNTHDTIQLHVETSEAQGSEDKVAILIKVIDEGIGMSIGAQKELF